MPREVNPAEYTINLEKNMNEFIDDFWEEFHYQQNKVNRSSERRMRSLLRKFNERVVKPYRIQSLASRDGEESLLDILSQEGETNHAS